MALKQRTPMNRGRGFRRHEPAVPREDRPTAPLRRLICTPNYGGGTTGPAPKERVVKSAAYENVVRALGYCVRCGKTCRPQFCHRDEGKGGHIKTDVREGWAGCGPETGSPGCHYIVGTSGTLSKEERRAEDLRLGELTRAEVLRRGWWPKSVPMWQEATA